MDQRRKLQAFLESVVGKGRVYFQPPEKMRLQYPCVVYQRERIQSRNADNLNYMNSVQYQATLITREPESPLMLKILEFPYSEHERTFRMDGLTHDVYKIFL